MEAFINELREWLDRELHIVISEGSPVQGYDKKIALVECAISRMKQYVLSQPFSSRDCEILYFKFLSVPILKLHFYYVALYNLELSRITCDREKLLRYLEDERNTIVSLFSENQQFYRYYRSGRNDEDGIYFTSKLHSRTSDFLIADKAFCRASLIAGKLLAYEDYRTILEDEIEHITAPNVQGKKIELRVPKSAVAEVIVPIYELQWIYIDGRPATLNELVKMAEKGLNIDLKDFKILDNVNRSRKKSTHPHLEQMIQASNDRRERLDP